MTNWNDVNNHLSEAVVETGRLDELLEALGCEPRGLPGGHVFRFRCPVHGGLGLNAQARAGGHTLPVYWQCFSHNCHVRLKSTLLGLVRGALAADPDRPAPLPDAVRFVEEFLSRGGAEPRVIPPPTQPKSFRAGWTREQVRGRLRIPSPYFLSRGFSPEVLDWFDVGESDRVEGRAVAPVYDDDGLACVGWVERAVDDECCAACGGYHHFLDECDRGGSRWRFPPGFRKGEWLYGYAEARRSTYPCVLLVEGVPDVLRAAQAGVPAVAGMGSNLSATQARKAAELGREVVVAFDNDEAGRSGAVKSLDQVQAAGAGAVVWHPPAGVKDVGEMEVGSVAGWLDGRLAERASTRVKG